MISAINPARRYRVYGLVVASDLPLTSIESAPDGAAVDLTLSLVDAGYFRSRAAGARVDLDDTIAYDVLADGSVYIRVIAVFEAIVSRDGREAICIPIDAPDDRSFEANLLNFVASTALTLQGEETLHATVVEIAGKAVGLLGPSGAGKSTLAASFIADGAELITDDMLRLRFGGHGVDAYAGPYRLKLFEEPARRYLPEAHERGRFNALSGKTMIEPREGALRAAYPLVALFFLADEAKELRAGEVRLRRLEGGDLVRTLIGSAMSFRYQATDRLARQLKFSEQLGRVLPVYELNYLRQFDIMDRLRARIRETAGL